MARKRMVSASSAVLIASVWIPVASPAAEVEAYGTTLARYWNQSYLGVASLGFRPAGGLTVPGDISYGMNALYKKTVHRLPQVMRKEMHGARSEARHFSKRMDEGWTP